MKKIDKDALLKQKFWILLGVFALLWIICLSFVVANAGGDIAKATADFKTTQGAITGITHPKNDSFLPPWQKYGDTFTKHKLAVWKIAWNGDAVPEGETLPNGQQPWRGQGGMYDWPEDADHPLNSLLPYPDSPFESRLREWYKTNQAYGKEFAKVRQDLQPDGTASLNGNPPSPPLGAVAFKGGYDNVMKPIDFEAARTPDAEECWLAQEDFWVKRELLYVVRDAVKMAARLDPVPDAKPAAEAKPASDAKDAPPAKDAKEEAPAKDATVKEAAPVKEAKDSKYLGKQVFQNASWEVTLLFDKDESGKQRISPDSRIKNIHVSHREQNLGNPAVPVNGVYFRLSQGDQEETGVKFYFTGQKLPWDKESSLGTDKEFLLLSIDPRRPMKLEQLFDRGNTPVASIDEIRIPYVSDRNANRPLVAAKPERFGKKDAAAADPTKTTAPSGGVIGGSAGAPPGGTFNVPPPGMIGSQTGGFGAAGGQSGSTTGAPPSNDKTANIGLDRDRYIFVTDQSRHLPLAMTLTVDQSHMNEILVALANSRLRFQTTQVEFHRLPAGASANATSVMGMPQPGGSSADMPRMTPAVQPGFGPPGAAAATMATPIFDNPNLVELTIYGIASLYERPRDDKK